VCGEVGEGSGGARGVGGEAGVVGGDRLCRVFFSLNLYRCKVVSNLCNPINASGTLKGNRDVGVLLGQKFCDRKNVN
jgi:hypothetical protein